MALGMIENGGAVGAVSDGEGHAQRGKTVDGPTEKGKLLVGVCVSALALVGGGEVGENTLGIQMRLTAHLGDGLQLVVGGVPTEKADAAHARVDLDMYFDGHPRLGGGARQLHAVLVGKDALSDVVVGQELGAPGGGVSEDQDGQGDALSTQLEGLLNVGDCNIVSAAGLIELGELDGAVSVGVGLDDTADLALRGRPDLVEVVRGVVEVDLGPGAVFFGRDGEFVLTAPHGASFLRTRYDAPRRGARLNIYQLLYHAAVAFVNRIGGRK